MGLHYDTGDIIEITIKDVTGRKTGVWKFNAADIKLGSGIVNHIIDKYGFKEKKKEVDFLDMKANW
jgi:hypothetical protein